METLRGRMLQLFILSLTLSGVVSATGVFFVKPTNDTLCPQHPCHTLEHYAQRWQLYLISNTVVQFLPGEHVLEGDWNVLSVENVSNLTLIGSDSMIFDSTQLGIPMAASRVACRRSETRFMFSNITELFITRLTFSECGGGTPQLKFALFLYDVLNLVLDSVTIQNSTGTGLIGYNLGKSSIRHSAFTFNQAISAPEVGNIILYYGKCSVETETNITSSWIMFGNGTSVGGLALKVNQSCYNVKIHIHNTTLKMNVGRNMLLRFNGFANNIITITDSQFEGGYNSESGAGMSIYATYISSQVSRIQSSRVYINNTKFIENYARFGGAVFLHPCTGTELYIDGSKFYRNVASNGGHITISWINTCTNMTVIVNNSLFEGGEATGSGGGGAISIGEPTSNFRLCSDGNRIYISNTQFVGNRAKLANGGAVILQRGIGTKLHIGKSEFNNNTALVGGHIALELLSDQNLFIIINNSHFENGKAFAGGGISVDVTADGSCTSVSGSMCKHVYIMNSRVCQNIADYGGGMAIKFYQSLFAFDVLIHNVSLSRNTATNRAGGNLHLSNLCTAKNSVTISKSTMEYGNASVTGGGMTFITNTSEICSPLIMVSHQPANIDIIDSMFQYNTASELGGGLAIWFDSYDSFCCSALVNITNVTFLNNNVNTLQVSLDGLPMFTKGGNIFIENRSGQWLNNSVRIHSCLVKGGVAFSGGGIWLTESVRHPVSGYVSEGLIISKTQFICNKATPGLSGASLATASELLTNYSMKTRICTPTLTVKLTVTDTIFDGTCSDSTNINIDATVSPTGYSVTFINVSFQGYSTDLSSPLPTYSQQLSDFSLHDVLSQYFPTKPGVVLSFVPNATFINCEFFESTADSALYVGSTTKVFFGGNITFRDNIATNGAGLILDNSVMYLRPNTHIIFSHNHATYAGGAIYVPPYVFIGSTCFYRFDELNQPKSDQNIQITFENNTALYAGSALYGGFVDICVLESSTRGETNNYFDSIFQVKNTDRDPSAISSDPYRVCICDDNIPQCDYVLWYTDKYPGALFHVQAVIVGQKYGIVPSVVRSTLGNTSAVLGDLQQSQYTGKSCTTLNYTVFSSHEVETITLMTENIPRRLTLNKVKINVTLLNCPWGFSLTGFPERCDCIKELRNHHIDTCDITTQTITRPPPLWIAYYHSGNSSGPPVEGLLVHDHCPFDYCKPEQLHIHLNDSDKQCAFNHSGILCGSCKPGLSLALGTSRCLQCSNKYLMLLFAFTAAGLALVFLLTLTNMTVSEGTIGGLIFYANIIHINRAIFFPNESAGIHKIILDILHTFISWINLDLGIETCFYNGMDMYTKAWLQFLFPIYIWTIAGGMIVSSHYSTTAAKLFRRHAVKVLATLFLLSFAKLQRTIITALSFTFLTYPDGTKTLWLYDSNIEYLHGKHFVLFIAAVLALLFFLIPYTLVLLFIQCLSKLDCRIFFWVKKLKPLFDAYTGPYKDRYRFWTGFLLVIRTILFLIFTLGNPGLNLTAISATSTCLAFAPAVYKKVWLTLLEYFLLLNLGVTSAATFYCRYTQFSGNQAVVVYLSVGTAFITFVGILVYHLYQCIINSRAWKMVSDRVTRKNNNRELVNIAAEGSDEEEEEEPALAEIRPLVLQFDEYREPVLVYEDQN